MLTNEEDTSNIRIRKEIHKLHNVTNHMTWRGLKLS